MEIRLDRVNLSFDLVEPRDLHVEEQKPPIILLHGVTYAKESWKNILQPIAEATRRKVYAFDARNHGDSGWSGIFNFTVMVEDLLQFIQTLNVERVILIGHSMGGKTAMYFSLKWPDRVEKLIVEDISPKPVAHGLKPVVQKYVELLSYIVDKIPSNVKDLAEAKNYAQKFLQDLVPLEKRSSRHGSADGSSLALVQNFHGNYKWKANLKVISDSYSKGMNSPLLLQGIFQGPTLMLYGTKSPYDVIADRNFTICHFPGACFRAVEGSSHEIHMEYEDVFLQEVLSFINEDRL